MTGDSGEPIATPSVCSKYWQLKQKYVEVSTNLKMELIQGSEMSANYNLTPGKYSKEHMQ